VKTTGPHCSVSILSRASASWTSCRSSPKLSRSPTRRVRPAWDYWFAVACGMSWTKNSAAANDTLEESALALIDAARGEQQRNVPARP
jgi:hypothetical protein